jgi:hypothetical protein
MAALLLEHGADPNPLVNGSFKCLDTAVMQGNADIVHKLLEHGVAIQGTGSDLQDTYPSPLHRAAESVHTEVVRALLSRPIYAAQWHPDMDCVLDAAIYRHDISMVQLLYERSVPVKRKRTIIGTMYTAANSPGANRVDWGRNVFKTLHSLKTHCQIRDRRRPAVLDTIRRPHEDYMHGSVRASNILVDARSKQMMAGYHIHAALRPPNILLDRRSIGSLGSRTPGSETTEAPNIKDPSIGAA